MKNSLKLPSIFRLKQLFTYLPESGKFVSNFKWPSYHSNPPFDPETLPDCVIFNSLSGRGELHVDGIKYRASIIAYFYMTGNSPTNRMRFYDDDCSNTRWNNLMHGAHDPNFIFTT